MENIAENDNDQIRQLNQRGVDRLPGLLGIEFLEASGDRLKSCLRIRPELLAPNGFLHAATVVALADTTCGYATVMSLPDGAENFTTIELKTNLVSTAREGTIYCEATPVHRGRSTQVWDAEVFTGSDTTDPASENRRALAVFRCTQMILWPR